MKFDNIAIVPASMLPFKEQWQAITDELPTGSTLLVLPTTANRSTELLTTIARQLRATGHSVKLVSLIQR